MVSGPFPVFGGDVMMPGPAGDSGSGAMASLVSKGAKGEPIPGRGDLQALAGEVLQKLSTIHNVDLRFSVHEGSGQLVVTVMDSETGEIIREIPPRELLNLAVRLDEMIGLLFDQTG